MDNTTIEELLLSAKQGNEIAREHLIKYYHPYILNTVGHICKRYIYWSDEEASIGLIAFNKAIETFEHEKGRTFLNYAYLLIKRDLVDFFRKESKESHLSFDFSLNEDINSQYDIKHSVDDYNKQIRSSEIIEEIIGLNNILLDFKISFDQLENYSPKHTDTRENLIKLANKFVHNEACVSALLKKKRLPIRMFSELTGSREKTFERHRKYIITLIIIMLHPEWLHLSSMIKKEGKRNET